MSNDKQRTRVDSHGRILGTCGMDSDETVAAEVGHVAAGRLLKASEIADYLGVCTGSIYLWRSQGRFPDPTIIPGRPMLWSWHDVLHFEKAYRKPDLDIVASMAALDKRLSGDTIAEKLDHIVQRLDDMHEALARRGHVRDLETEAGCINAGE